MLWTISTKQQSEQFWKEGGLRSMATSKAEFLQSIADTKAKVLVLQEAKTNAGMSAADEEEVKAALIDLSITADPTVPNP